MESMPAGRDRFVAVSILLFLSGCLAVLIFATSLVAPPRGESTIFRPKCQGSSATVVPSRGGNLVGTGGRDVIVGDGGSENIRGLGGHDLICGGGGGDKINGGGGKDDIYGEGGEDYVNAESGDDFVDGGAGGDDLHGKQGHDLVFGGGGNDEVLGGPDADELSGGAGNDRLLDRSANRNSLLGDEGKDFIRGGSRADVIRGGAGIDDVDGGGGADRIKGNGGRDDLLGGKGNDAINGGEDNDLLVGDVGKDTLRGGGGVDRCSGGSGVDLCDGGQPHPADRSTDPDVCDRDVETRRSCRETDSFPRAYIGKGRAVVTVGEEDTGGPTIETWTWSDDFTRVPGRDPDEPGYGPSGGTATVVVSGKHLGCMVRGEATTIPFGPDDGNEGITWDESGSLGRTFDLYIVIEWHHPTDDMDVTYSGCPEFGTYEDGVHPYGPAGFFVSSGRAANPASTLSGSSDDNTGCGSATCTWTLEPQH